jgi:hypothetical protein
MRTEYYANRTNRKPQEPKSKGKKPAKPTKSKGKKTAPTKENPDENEKEWLPGWDFHMWPDRQVKRTISGLIRPQLDYIERMKKAWRPDRPNKMEMPEDWFVSSHLVHLHAP